ncbi:MAG: 2-oxo acid dehydrogenase subunit E2 [Melioribacter sp.]|uniref:2-oxo acid dehydrogenase subunit E2 n=1 Tax=Rosettibacter primus TaxID=3111523 RepID=UPI00247EA783|nr:2-oxo acid dehydrogenase subunit E2 [Melioribacter sp.]
MIVDFKLPHLGENISSADIIKVLVKEGDKIEIDQIIVEIETDKATIEVPSEVSGIIKKVHVKEGTKAKVGEPLISVEVAEEDKSKIDKLEKVSEESTSEQVQLTSQTAHTSAEIENKKAKAESSPLHSEIKEVVKEHTHMPQVIDIPQDIVKTIVPAAPSVRRFAREIGIDITQVRGSGPKGRITIDDVKAYAKLLNEQIQKGGIVPGVQVGISKEPLPDFSKWGEIERLPMSNVRRKTAEHLSYAWNTVPHVTQFDKADISEVEKFRKQYSNKVETAGGKLTVTAILLKVVASALKIFPQFNSSVDMEKNEVIYKKYINIGVAVDTEKGLLVPVIKDVDKKNITQLSIELSEISRKARDKKLSLEEMQGGCFTISNLGGIGGTYFTPIVNTPEVAILGVSKSVFEPVYVDGEFKPRLMLPLSLSYDHRIIDGADAIRFLRWIVNALENPLLIFLEG